MHTLLKFFVDNATAFKTLSVVAGSLVALVKLGPKALSAWKAFQDRRYLVKNLGAKRYTPEQIRFATIHYIEPNCQNIDPSGTEDWRYICPVRQKIFEAIDNLLTSQVQYRHTILLADSGMGKSSFVLNYFARHRRKFWSAFRLAVIPLGAPDTDTLIQNVPKKDQTVLFLDAFDEDTRAISNHKERLQTILALSGDFRHVLITCRTQFFIQDDEIPREVVGVIRFGPANSSKQYTFYKLYLSPFSDDQVVRYIKKRYPLWRSADRKRALELARRIGDLTARPMLLANIDDLIHTQRLFKYSFELYEEMLRRWIEREKPFVSDDQALWRFSEAVAEDIFAKRTERGAETIPYTSIEPLARNAGIALANWQLSGRSLLNRTADGHFKFAHRSILEWNLVRGYVSGRIEVASEWTDQMIDFLWQVVVSRYGEKSERVPVERMKAVKLESLAFVLWAAKNRVALFPLSSISEEFAAGESAVSTFVDYANSLIFDIEPNSLNGQGSEIFIEYSTKVTARLKLARTAQEVAREGDRKSATHIEVITPKAPDDNHIIAVRHKTKGVSLLDLLRVSPDTTSMEVRSAAVQWRWDVISTLLAYGASYIWGWDYFAQSGLDFAKEVRITHLGGKTEKWQFEEDVLKDSFVS